MFQNNRSVIKQAQTHFTASDRQRRSSTRAEIINQFKMRSSQFFRINCNPSLGLHKRDKLTSALFDSLIERMNKLEAGMLADWFFTLFASLEKEKFIPTIQLFSQFADLCFQYQVQNCLPKPDKLPLLFKCSDMNYLEICIAALAGSHNKHAQAQLLDQLPNWTLVNAAFDKGLPFICDQMVYNDTIPLLSYAELANIVDYKNYKSSVLVYMAITPLNYADPKELPEANKISCTADERIHPKMDFFSCLKFINILEEVTSKHISLIKKRMLISRFINSIRQFSIEEFIPITNKLIEISEMDYCEELFGNPAINPAEKELNYSLQISQCLMLVSKSHR